MTAPRNITTHWSGGTGQADITLPLCVAGDLLVILVGGGNQVTATPSGWTGYSSLTGQEAQGKRFTKVADGSESGGAVSIFFDGNDMRYVVALAVRDWDDHELNDFERIGTAGGTYPAGLHTWNADTYQGDLVVTFTFARNAATAPTMDRGVLWEARASGGSSAALYLESAAAYEVGADFAIDYPERSGHVSYSMAVYGFTWTDWFDSDDYEVVQDQLTVQVNDTKVDNDSASSFSGYPTITQDTFLDSQSAQVFTTTDTLNPAYWSHDRATDFDGEFTRSWSTRRRYLLYASELTDTDLALGGDETPVPPEGYEDLEYESEARAVAAWSNAGIFDDAYDDTDGSSGEDLAGGEFATVIRSATGVTWNDEYVGAFDFVDDWDHTTSVLIHLHPGQLSEGATTTTIDLTAGLDPIHPGRLAVASFVTGPTGSGDPALDLKSYTFEGIARFGATYGFAAIDEEDPEDDGGLHWVIQPGRVRYLVRRSPVVDIIPAVVAVLRNYPRDDEYGFGGVKRNWPPPRGRRNYGQQP